MNKEESPQQKQSRSDWRAGRTSAQRQAALNAKATLEFLKKNPGSTKVDVIAAGIRPNFLMLQQHGLAYYAGGGKKSLHAQWYAKGYERREP